jgi:hypothetical protein
MDSLAASLEAESRAKTEAMRLKKKLESDINDLEIALDHANKANSEGQKTIKKYQFQLREVEQLWKEECLLRQEIVEKVGLAERKGNALEGELEESRALLDSAERARKLTEMELAEANVTVNEMIEINSKANLEKRFLESSIHTIHAEIDEMIAQAKKSEEKSKRAILDAARLSNELQSEHEHSLQQEKAKRALELQIVELGRCLKEANETASIVGRSALIKLEARIRELEMNLGDLQSKTSETNKAYQKTERRVKELLFQQEEDRRNQQLMSDLAGKLHQKIKTYKKQIEEAEEIAALNLAKYRKAQQEMEEAEERSKSASAHLPHLSHSE